MIGPPGGSVDDASARRIGDVGSRSRPTLLPRHVPAGRAHRPRSPRRATSHAPLDHTSQLPVRSSSFVLDHRRYATPTPTLSHSHPHPVTHTYTPTPLHPYTPTPFPFIRCCGWCFLAWTIRLLFVWYRFEHPDHPSAHLVAATTRLPRAQ